MIQRIDVTAQDSPEARRVVAEAALLGVGGLTGCTFTRVYFLRGEMDRAAIDRLCHEVLVDPVTDSFTVTPEPSVTPGPAGTPEPSVTPGPAGSEGAAAVEVAPLPGVTDTAARELERAARQLGIGTPAAATARRYVLHGSLSAADADLLTRRVLANHTIERSGPGHLRAVFDAPTPPSESVERIDIESMDDDELAALSRDRLLSLDLAELHAIRDHFGSEGRAPTDAELETLAQTWSEHCVHKTFRAEIELSRVAADGTIALSRHDGLLRALREATSELDPPWLRSAFVDDAGIVAFDDRFDLAIKVETHNHPSALEPFGGANTGVGGVVRDVLGVSARPIACTDVLCFGPPDLAHDELPEGVLHPRRVRQGVVEGISDYGNKLGLPTVNGAVLYASGYTANPLVFCGAVGLLPRGSHRSEAQPGDLAVCIGGRVGRDGIHGATFSSAQMDSATAAVVGAVVQIGDPITEKGLIEVVERARDRGLYNAITDCGAGGLSSAVGEMGERLGAEVDLSGVRLKYPGLAPWEIWVSEAQERMVLAVPPARLGELCDLCADWDVELTVLGSFGADRRLRVRHGALDVVDLPMGLLHEGLPRRQMRAVWRDPKPAAAHSKDAGPVAASRLPDAAGVLALLRHLEVASKADIVRRYDHEVRGGTVVRPLVGPCALGPSDAAVLKPLGTEGMRAVVLANGICPRVGRLDPEAMALFAIDEAVRNLVAVGGDPGQVALLDNFCWGDPAKPDRLGSLVLAVQGCADGSRLYRMPFVSGKDSLNNEFAGTAIPGTLLITALGIIADLRRAIHSAGMRPGDDVWLVGSGSAALGGSLADEVFSLGATAVPEPLADPLPRYRAVHAANSAGLLSAAHDCSDGGLALALAEMCIGAQGAMSVTVPANPVPADSVPADSVPAGSGGSFETLFNEAPGRIVFTAPPGGRGELTEIVGDHARIVGTVHDGDAMTLAVSCDDADQAGIELDIAEMTEAFVRGSTDGGRC